MTYEIDPTTNLPKLPDRHFFEIIRWPYGHSYRYAVVIKRRGKGFFTSWDKTLIRCDIYASPGSSSHAGYNANVTRQQILDTATRALANLNGEETPERYREEVNYRNANLLGQYPPNKLGDKK